MTDKTKVKWKAIAIVFIILFTIETFYILWGFAMYYSGEKKIKECLYNICSGYPDASYEDNVCFCYDYDLLGDLMVVKEEYMG